MEDNVNGTEGIDSNIGFDSVEAILKDEKLGKLLTSHIDSQIGTAITSYKDKGFATAVDKAVEERLKQRETKTPEQIRFEEYENKLTTMQNQIKDKELNEMKMVNRASAVKRLQDAKLPTDLVDFFIDADSTKTEDNVSKVITALGGFVQDAKKNVLLNNNVKIPGRTTNKGDLQEPGEGATKAEWSAYWKQTRK